MKQHQLKRVISWIMAIAMILTILPTAIFAATPDKLYLKPNSNWTQANARFAAYFYGNGEKWVSMTDSDGDGLYEVDVPSGFTQVIFCRMNPSSSANNWNNKWNQTGDLTIPTNGNNCFTVKAGTWDGATTSWSKYVYVAPVFTIAGTISPAGWSPESGEQLTEENNYTYTYTGVAAGSYEFKVTDGTWNNAWGNGSANYAITVTERSDVTITFVPSTKAISVQMTPAPGEDEPVEDVTYRVTLHFANNKAWGAVNLYAWSGATILTATWPGSAVSQGEDGFFTASFEYEAPANQPLNFIVNNGSVQTVDLTLAAGAFTQNADGVYTAEKWVVLTDADAEGKYNAELKGSASGIAVGPIVKDQSVTFTYSAPSASEVYVAGTFNGWNTTSHALKKDAGGVWSITINNLSYGIHEYKFIVDGAWVADPCNGRVQGDNSAFTIANPDAVDNNKINVVITYTRDDVNYTNWNVAAWNAPGLKDQYDFTLSGSVATTTITLDGRASQTLGFKVRKSVGTNKWAEQSGEVRVNLADIVSGTIYVNIANDFSSTQTLGADVVFGNKVSDIQLDYDKNTITITTVKAVNDPQSAFLLYKNGVLSDIVESITASVNSYTLTLKETLDLKTLYQYTIRFNEDAKFADNDYSIGYDSAYSSTKFEEAYIYEGKDQGATWSEGSTKFVVWAPTAEAVSVNIYTTGTKGINDREQVVTMNPGEKGTWVVTIDGDLHGKYYTYSVKVNGQTVEAVDPYARTTGVNGNRGMIINLQSTDPVDGWKEINKLSSYTDAIIYELHVRDFSIDASSGVSEANRGKFMAFTETNSTAMKHLTDLGITHVHLLPIYDYASVDETTCDNFNWGYDPQNYNAPEGSYSTDPYNGEVRVQEMKAMVNALHANGIGVIMDVVYNHVYNASTFGFNQIVPGYFSRPDSNTSGCGNDTASEREMVRKYIVESVLYWAEEYHLDGFRFDLVGLLDVETINQIVTEVHKFRPDIIFYGEGWDMDSTNKEEGTEMAKQGNSSKTPGFAYFSDSIRNGLGGNNGNSLGFASGALNSNSIANEWLAKPWWTNNPQQVIQYASCHDNYTLVDKLILSTNSGSLNDTIIQMNNLAAAYYLTAQGIPFIHAGEEFLREKLDEHGERNENSYNASDYVNHLEWSNLQKVDYAANVEYYKGLIAFRKAHPALRYATAELVAENVTLGLSTGSLLAYLVDGNGSDAENSDILVIFNSASTPTTVNLPEGVWDVCVDGKTAGTETLYTAQNTVLVDGISAMILVQADAGKNEVETKSEVTVYFSNNQYWSNVYAHYWGGTTGTTWPGVAMQWVEKNEYGQDIYCVTVPANSAGLVFTDGNAKTVDITALVDGQGYYCDTEVDGKWTCGTYTYAISGGNGFVNDGIYEGDTQYYLFGYINGQNYACEETSTAMGRYQFVDGKITVHFEQDSYIGIKGTDGTWYMTDGYLGSVTSALLKDTDKGTLTQAQWDKLLIPGGREVTITLVVNSNNTVTLKLDMARDGVEDTSGVQNGTTLHCWNWSFNAIAENMAAIAAQGFTAIQTSPIQPLKEATANMPVGTNWWVYYQPVDFVITTAEGNALGTKADFEKMCATAEHFGIKVIVDVVTNHLGNETGNDLSTAIPAYLWNDAYWHNITKDITNWNDRYNMTQYSMGGLPDLNTANADIQQFVLDFLKECVDAGADGFRFDAAKSIETPDDDAVFASTFWPTVVGGIQNYAGGDLYIYGEILDNSVIAISSYTQYMSVTDNSWGNALRNSIAAGKAGLMAGYHKATDASNLVIWAESHDTFATDDLTQSSADISVDVINKTWALVAARADAMGLYLARPESVTQMLGIASATGWSYPEVKAVNEFHNAFVGQSETLGNSGNISYVVRGDSGIVLVNVSGTTANVALADISMADGTYCDCLSGNTFTVTNGQLSGQIGSTGIAVLGLGHSYNAVVTEPTCTTGGYTTYTCACGDSYVGAEVDALGHTYGEGVVTTEPTCTTTGVKTFTCSCGDSYTEEIPATGIHTHGEQTNCSVAVNCSVCGAEIYAAKDHTYDGEQDADCNVCGAEREVETRLNMAGVHRTASLSLKDVVYVNPFVAFLIPGESGNTNVPGLTVEYVEANGLLLFWSETEWNKLTGEPVLGTETASSTLTNEGTYRDTTMGDAEAIQEYSGKSMGIPAKEFNDTLYYRTYIEIDGEIYYGEILTYSVATYCVNQIKKASNPEKLRAVCATMLNYGAAAQVQFTHNVDKLASAVLPELVEAGHLDAKYLVQDWDINMLPAASVADASMTVNFAQTSGTAITEKTLQLKGAIEMRVTLGYKIVKGVATQIPADATIEFYFWESDRYAALLAAGTPLSKSNASYVRSSANEGEVEALAKTQYGYEYAAKPNAIAARLMDDTIYFVAIVREADGTEYCTGVNSYSPIQYTKNAINKAGNPEKLKDLCRWIDLYCKAAQDYFGKKK